LGGEEASSVGLEPKRESWLGHFPSVVGWEEEKRGERVSFEADDACFLRKKGKGREKEKAEE